MYKHKCWQKKKIGNVCLHKTGNYAHGYYKTLASGYQTLEQRLTLVIRTNMAMPIHRY